MAEAVVFSAVGTCLNAVVGAIGPNFLLKIKSVYNLRSNFATLKEEMKNLSEKKGRIKEEIELETRNGNKETIQVREWLTNIENVEVRMGDIEERFTTAAGCSLKFFRSELAEKVVELLGEVAQIMSMADFPQHPLVMADLRLKVVEVLPGPSITNQKTASANLARVLDYLMDDSSGTIGIVGMGGVGKTTLIKNLNNELESLNKELDNSKSFSIVIWVTVSKDLDKEKVQDRIAARLKMTKIEGESLDAKAIRLFTRLKMEKFVVILDDVWERIDLDSIGIPKPKEHPGSKVILTTRRSDVCGLMETDVDFTVAVLTPEESWDLFRQSAGHETVDLQNVKPYAQKVVEECAGLPLAITTVGRAMRGKKMIVLWEGALNALKKSTLLPNMIGVEKELYLPLKLSYDSLDDNIKPCFMYCALYPEDFEIETRELLQCWIAEGFIDHDEEDPAEDAYYIGIALIENLLSSYMLERGNRRGTIRMHDVVRDVAIWIDQTSSENDHVKSFNRSRSGLCVTPGKQMWCSGSYKRVSLMYNKIGMLPDSLQQSAHITTLLLQGNPQFENVSAEFLRAVQKTLRVLNLSETIIKFLPPVDLEELRALLLRNCSHLIEFPSLQNLIKLQMLDVSGTSVARSPDDVEKILWGLRSQQHLLELYVDLYHLPRITAEKDSIWLTRLRRFRICIGKSPTKRHLITKHDQRLVHLCGENYFSRDTMVLWQNASALVLSRCGDFMKLWMGITVAHSLDCLKSFTMDGCSWGGSMERNSGLELFPNLEELSFSDVTDLCSINEFIISCGKKIRVIRIENCQNFARLFPLSLLDKLESLEKISVSSCDNLMEIIVDGTVLNNALPNLKVMEFKKLPRLRSVCQNALASLRLKRVHVEGCPLLKKLPLSSQHAETMKVIEGELSWWEQLQWDDEGTKLSLQKLISPQ